MLTQSELRRILTDLESDSVERTESTTNTDKFAEAVCAFANDLPNHRKPGYLLIGAKNDGKLSGLTVTDQLLLTLSDLRSAGNIQPLPTITVFKQSFDEGELAIVEVQPAVMPPVRYKGRVYVRVGPRKAIASEQDERILTEKREARFRSIDAIPETEAVLNDLSLDLFTSYRRMAVATETIEANHRSIEEQLASLRLFDLARKVPTVAGLLLFGKNPRFFLPGAYIQFLRLPGNTLTEVPEDQVEISGDLQSCIRILEAKIRSSTETRLQKKDNFQEVLLKSYPETALRELFLNAILHRDYQSNTPIRFYWFTDRIEIQNPGGLFGEVTSDTLTKRNSYRNPVLAEALKIMGYVNKFGYGIQRSQAALAENGNQPAQFEIDDRSFLVKIFKSVA